MTRIDKSKKNIKYGLGFQAVYLIGTFFIRIILLKYAGLTAVSINALITEIVVVLSVADLGVWAAMSYSLYKPLAEKNERQIAAVMGAFRKTYFVIGAVIITLGLALFPLMPRLLKNIEVSKGYFFAAYTLALLGVGLPYFFSYNKALIDADQKNYVLAKAGAVIRVAMFGVEFAAILLTKELLVYLTLELIYQLAYFGASAYIVRNRYPYIRESVPLSKDEKKAIFTNVRRMFVGRVANKVLNSTDNILISSIVGTLMVGIYSQYSMFINGFLRIFSQVNEAITGSIGNMLATESNDYCRRTFRNITYIFFVGSAFVSGCFFAGINPFLTGVIGKEFTLEQAVLLVVVFNVFAEIIKMPLWTFYTANGLFQEDQVISLIGCLVNIIISVVWGRKYGIIGIFAGTQVSLLIMLIYKAIHIYKTSFRGKWYEGILMFAAYYGIFSVIIAASVWFCRYTEGLNDILQFLVNCIFTGTVSLLVTIVPFINTEEFRYGLKVLMPASAPGKEGSV